MKSLIEKTMFLTIDMWIGDKPSSFEFAIGYWCCKEVAWNASIFVLTFRSHCYVDSITRVIYMALYNSEMKLLKNFT
jgi:hypothetical protein